MADHNGTTTQSFAAVTQAATGNHDHKIGTVTQSLPAMTQAVTGWNCFQLISTVNVWAGPQEVYGELLHDVVIAGDALSSIETVELHDTVQVSDEYTYDRTVTIHDTVLASEHMNVDWTTTLESGNIETFAEMTYTSGATLVGAVQVSDAYTPIRNAGLQSTVYASEELTHSAVTTETLVSTARAYGYTVSAATAELLTSTVQISDAQEVTRVTTEEVTSTVQATEVISGSASSFEELLGSVEVSDLITFDGSVYNEVLHDTVHAMGFPWAADPGAVAWVMNTETGGLSTYDNFDITSITGFNGVLYATTNNGVYALTGAQDESRNIASDVGTGFLDMGTQQTKRISDVYVGYTGGQLQLDVETYDGPQEVYTYEMEEREADAPRNNRIKIGKGLSSRYWRFSVKNVDGADFQVYDMSAIVGISKRRL